MKRAIGVVFLLTLLSLVGWVPGSDAALPKCPQPDCDALHGTACSTPGATTLCAVWFSSTCPTFKCRCLSSLHWICP
jgi:hypothetical protein